jgi:hypothetical protein
MDKSGLASLPPLIDAALSTPSADSWAAIAEWAGSNVGCADLTTLRQLKQSLAIWPKELPRQAPKPWLKDTRSLTGHAFNATYRHLLGLCLDVKEVDTYPLYIAAVAQEPRLRLRDGSPAVSLHRQQRGVVETSTGKKVAMNGDVPGMADLGGTLTVEWGFMEGCACSKTAVGTVVVRCPHCNYAVYVPQRLQLYIELEIKLDGKIPPQAREYTRTSRRQLTDTECQQVQRQQAQLARGGCYIFADRVVDAVGAVVRYRDEVLARIGA